MKITRQRHLVFVFALAGFFRPAWGNQLLLTSGMTGNFPLIREDLITTSTAPLLTRDSTYDFSFGGPDQNSLLTGSFEASGTSTYGSLGVRVSADQGGGPGAPTITEFSSALWQDTVTFQAGASGYAQLIFSVTGSLGNASTFGSGAIGGSGEIRFYGGVAGTPTFQDYFLTQPTQFTPNSNIVNTTYVSAQIPFVPGIPVSIEGTVGANLTITCVPDVIAGECTYPWSAESSLDFGHTIELTGIELFDVNNSAIHDFSITSESGTVYTSDGVVPEPDSGLLLAAGVGVLMLIYRRSSPYPGERLAARGRSIQAG